MLLRCNYKYANKNFSGLAATPQILNSCTYVRIEIIPFIKYAIKVVTFYIMLLLRYFRHCKKSVLWKKIIEICCFIKLPYLKKKQNFACRVLYKNKSNICLLNIIPLTIPFLPPYYLTPSFLPYPYPSTR